LYSPTLLAQITLDSSALSCLCLSTPDPCIVYFIKMHLLKFTAIALISGQQVASWGDLGHRTVALIAQKYLTSEAAQMYDSILANNKGFDFSDAATWADTVKHPRPYTKTWHYVGELQ
jgi:hypothetical protein